MSLLAVLGRPGAETALYSRLLSARLRCEVLSVPKAAAMEAAAGTHLGSKLREAAAAIESGAAAGSLLPSNLVAPIVSERLRRALLVPARRPNQVNLVLSGFPRTPDQVQMLQMAGASAGVPAVPKVIHLVLGRDEAERRLAIRRVCASCGEAMYPMPAKDQQQAKAAAASLPGGAEASAAAGAASANLHTHLVEHASECDHPRPVRAAADTPDLVARRLDAFDQFSLPLLESMRARGAEVVEVPVLESAEETWRSVELAVGLEPLDGPEGAAAAAGAAVAAACGG